MYKKSIARIEKESESNQAELSNPALHDIIATNHVLLSKKPRKERLSRACKAVIIMIILGLVAIGIVVLTLVLAHSRNTLMAIISRSAEANLLPTSNNSRILSIDQENSTTISTIDEQKEDQNWQKTTVSLTSNNLPRLTTQNVHISSSVMRTKPQNEYISSNTQSMKPYPSSNTMINEQSTILTTVQTTISNQQTSFIPNSHHFMTTMIIKNELMTTMKDQEGIQTSSNNQTMSAIDTTPILARDDIAATPEQTSFTSFISRHFDFQSSTISNHDKKKNNTSAKNFKTAGEDEDAMDDIFF